MLAVAALALVACNLVRSTPDPDAPAPAAELVAQGRAALERGDHGAARSRFREAAALRPRTEVTSQAAFLAAEADFLAGNTRRALKEFLDFIDENPISAHLEQVEERVFEIGVQYLEGRARGFLGLFPDRSRGVSALETVLESFPRGRKAPEAQRLLADYHFERDSYPEAVAEYRELIQRFPDSEWLPLARFRMGMCYIKQSRGADYDPSLLIRARQEFRLYVELHPQGPQIAKVRQEIVRIDDLLAEKAYRIGRFYEKRDRLEAARIYYRKALEDHEGSRWGEAARESLERLKPREEGG